MTPDTHPPEVESPEKRLAARKDLLVKEKEATQARDRVNADRRRPPMFRIDKPYAVEQADGTVGLLDLFEGRQQLVIYMAKRLARSGECGFRPRHLKDGGEGTSRRTSGALCHRAGDGRVSAGGGRARIRPRRFLPPI
jgi:hypothetical protein